MIYSYGVNNNKTIYNLALKMRHASYENLETTHNG